MRWMQRTSDSLRGVDVAVIGGGAVGASTALELSNRGASVALLERGSGLAWGCSAGNAGIVGPSHVLPLANPAAVIDGIRWMARPDSPFYVRPKPSVVPWLARFLAAATPARVRQSGDVLRDLAIHSAALHGRIAREGLATGYRKTGLLNVFNSQKAFLDACDEALRDHAGGINAEILSAAELSRVGPPLAAPVAGAILYPDESHCDPQAFVSAMGARAEENGVDIRTGIEVLEIRRNGDRIESLWTTSGELPVGQVVVAAGVWSPRLIETLGLDLPIEAGKGYHVDVATRAGDPELPIWLHEDRVVITPLGERVRFAGTLELSGLDHDVSRRRVDAISDAVGRLFPAMAGRPTVDVWRGLRPCTPDGLPVIGPVPTFENVILATGHGMWGLQLAPITAQLVGQLIAGQAPSHDLTPLRPERFRAGPAPSARRSLDPAVS